MGLCVRRLEVNSLQKFRFCAAVVAGLQERQSEIVVSLREVWIATNEFPKNTDGAGHIVFLTQHQTQLDTRVRVLGIQAEGFVQFGDCLVEMSRLRQRKAEIVMRLRKISIRHNRLLELLKCAIAVAFAPEKKS